MTVPFIAACFVPPGLLLAWVQVKRARVAAWTRTQGTVIEMCSPGRRGQTLAPVVRFVTEQGQVFVHTSRAGSSPPGYRVGEIVPLVYDPVDPRRAAIPHLFQLWCSEAILGIILGGYFVMGLVVAIVHPS